MHRRTRCQPAGKQFTAGGLVFGRRAARAIAEPRSASQWPHTPALNGAELRQVSLVEPRVSATAVVRFTGPRNRTDGSCGSRSRSSRGDGLRAADETLRAPAAGEEVDPETANMLFAAHAITICALARDESRGAITAWTTLTAIPERVGMHTLPWMRPAAATVPGTEGLASYAHCLTG